MKLSQTIFQRKFSFVAYKNLKLTLAQSTFSKDFVHTDRGDLYPVIEKSEGAQELVEENAYFVKNGKVKRFFAAFFPYATYELSATLKKGTAGFCFSFPNNRASICVTKRTLSYSFEERKEVLPLPKFVKSDFTLIVTCRPYAFDVYFFHQGKAELFHSFQDERLKDTNVYDCFSKSSVLFEIDGSAKIKNATSYLDSGVSLADMRTVRYENGEVMVENGKVYFTASIRMEAGGFQGVFSWIPTTSEFSLVGALFYDGGDHRWCGDVAASVLYHREKKLWYLWVCSFFHDHILGSASFEGDPRFGVNVVDIRLMEKADEGDSVTEFKGFCGDEDPDFYFDENDGKWKMAICRLQPQNGKYRYQFFQSDEPLRGYTYIGSGLDGEETGGSFVEFEGERYFVCGNSFFQKSDYRIYGKEGIENAKFDYPDGGFRGWGTIVPVKIGTRKRYFWLTFDRHGGSGYTWSYGSLYCFEAEQNNERLSR